MTKRRALRRSAYKLDELLRRIMTAVAYILLLPCLIGMIIFFILAVKINNSSLHISSKPFNYTTIRKFVNTLIIA
jgi:hypothetical protein